MTAYRILFAGFLAMTAPLISKAQSSSEAPRYFVGVAGSFGGYPLPEGSGINVATIVPTLGLQLLPRLALQVSGALDTDYQSHNYGTHIVDPTTGRDAYFEESSYKARRRTLVVPVLGRYTLTRRPARRLQVDVLGGLSLVQLTSRSTITRLNATPADSGSYTRTSRSTGVCFTAGAGVRYALPWRGLEATAEAVLNRQIASKARDFWFNPNLAVGLRYRFGH